MSTLFYDTHLPVKLRDTGEVQLSVKTIKFKARSFTNSGCTCLEWLLCQTLILIHSQASQNLLFLEL